MKNVAFHTALRECYWRGKRLNVTRLAAALGLNRPRLTEILHNQRTGESRREIVKWFNRNCPTVTPRLLAALQWDEQGNFVPAGTMLHVEQVSNTHAEVDGSGEGEDD